MKTDKTDNFEEFLKTLKNRKKIVPEHIDNVSEEEIKEFIKKAEPKDPKREFK